MANHQVAVKALVASNTVLVLIVMLLLRKLRRKALSLNNFIDEVGHSRRSTIAASWTLKLVWSSGSSRKELSLASSGPPTSIDAAEKLDLAVKSKHNKMQIRGEPTAVDVDYYSGYVCLNCQLFRRFGIGWSELPVLNTDRHHISLFSFRGYVDLATMDAVKSDLEELLSRRASFVVGKPLAENCLPLFQTAMAVEFVDNRIVEDLRAYAQANTHLISWYHSTANGLHICL